MEIVVGYEGSNAAQCALDLAVAQARAFDARVLVVNSQEGGEDSPKENIIRARQQLEFAQDFLVRHRVPCETHLLVRGNLPGEDIVEFARDRQAALIIVALKRRSKVGKMLLGSNAQYVVLNAGCPVLTCK